jgi:quercetin dioxygenase-like cupin family protein
LPLGGRSRKLIIAGFAGAALGQKAAPAAPRGVTLKLLQSLDLGPQIAAMEGYQLQLRFITFEPGGAIPLHDHLDRPAIGYVLKGTHTEHRKGGATIDYGPGANWTEGRDAVHWGENRGTTPQTMVHVQIVKKK